MKWDLNADKTESYIRLSKKENWELNKLSARRCFHPRFESGGRKKINRSTYAKRSCKKPRLLYDRRSYVLSKLTRFPGGSTIVPIGLKRARDWVIYQPANLNNVDTAAWRPNATHLVTVHVNDPLAIVWHDILRDPENGNYRARERERREQRRGRRRGAKSWASC